MKLKNNKIKIKNKILTSKKFDISNFEIYDFIEGFAVIEDLTTNKEGWINKDFTKLINPIFDRCYNFKNGFSVFEKNTRFGWIDSSGEILVEGFDICYNFSEGFARFKKNGKQGWIDTSGKILAEEFDDCFSFQNGFACFEKDNKKGWIDKNGKIYTKNPY